MYYGSFMIHEL